MAERLKTIKDTACEIKSRVSGVNVSILDLIDHARFDYELLEAIANRTFFTAEYINRTITTTLDSTRYITMILQRIDCSSKEDVWNNTLNLHLVTCKPTINPNSMIIASIIPAFITMIILSMVNTRVQKRKCCGGRPGLAIPINLLDSYENRFSYAFAFGATISRIMAVIIFGDFSLVFGDSFTESRSRANPSWYSGLYRTGAAILIGISYYPFFACISTHQRLLGAVLGSVYSAIWLFAYLSQLVECTTFSGDHISAFEFLAAAGLTLFCHGLLLLCFLQVLVRSLRSKKRGIVISKQEWKENYKYLYVKELLKPIPESAKTIDGWRGQVASKIYKWKPGFKYSTRIICIFTTAGNVLITLAICYVILARWVRRSINEYRKIAWADYSSELKEISEISFICWIFATVVSFIKDIVMLANMATWYRGHILRLQRGDRSFLPVTVAKQAPPDIVVASFKFTGFQVAYVLWGFVISQLVFFVIFALVALLLIWPLTRGLNSPIVLLLQRIWPSIFITVLTIVIQKLMAKFIFLRDAGATLSLDNRRLFHISSYFLFFLNIFVGIFSCLQRIIFAMLLGVVFLPRLQKSTLPRDWELFDPGFKTYLGYLRLEHTQTNPVVLTFSQLLVETVAFAEDVERGTRMEGLCAMIGKKARNRWFLAITLINNPELKDSRRREKFIDRSAFTAIRTLAVDAFMVSHRLLDTNETDT